MVSSCFPSRIKFGSFPFRLRRRGGAPKWLFPSFLPSQNVPGQKIRADALGKIPQSIGRRDGAPSPLPGLGPTWHCSAGGRNPSPTKHAVQLSRYVRKCLQSFSARPANFCRVITRACVSHSSVSHIAPVKYIMRGSRHTADTTDRMDSIPVGPLCPRTRSFRRKFRMPHIPAATKRS